MEALISEMTMILEQLPNNTKIGITAFSSSGYRNNKGWNESSSGLARLGDEGTRDSAIQFVNTLDDERVTRWGALILGMQFNKHLMTQKPTRCTSCLTDSPTKTETVEAGQIGITNLQQIFMPSKTTIDNLMAKIDHSS